MNKIHVEADFTVTDDQREHARHINGLEAATAEYEAAIKKVTGQDVKIRIYVRRHKEAATGVAGASASPVAVTAVSSSESQDRLQAAGLRPRQTAAE